MRKNLNLISSILVLVFILFVITVGCKKDDDTVDENKPPAKPTEGTHTTDVDEIVWNWNSVAGADGYKWNTANDFATAIDKLDSTTHEETGLSEATAYTRYVWAYNQWGNSPELEMTAETSSIPRPNCGTVTDFDNNVYNTVIIGDQCWMIENLRTTHYNDGTPIDNVTDDSLWIDLEEGAYAWFYNDYNTYGETYGALYNWYAVENGDLCPPGWHVPTDDEWTDLTDHLGGEQVAGGHLKEAGTNHWDSPNTGATNSTGFTALPGGNRYYLTGGFFVLGNTGYYWSSTDYMTWSYYREFSYNSAGVTRNFVNRTYGFSVRCIKTD